MKIDLMTLQKAVCGNAAAFRCRRSLQPAGKQGDKVFPPTYAGGTYAVEFRRWPGRTDSVPCVLMDSVQSQANRMEEALHEAREEIGLPLVEVDFSDCGPTGNKTTDAAPDRLRDAVGKLSVLQLPHRLADAILRDSEVKEVNGKEEKMVAFRKSQQGIAATDATVSNATALYRLCPTALLFGMWDSTGPKGGLGAKFERAVVSEVVGVGAEIGDLMRGVRRDPLEIRAKAEVYRLDETRWAVTAATMPTGAKALAPSAINHSSVPFPKHRDKKTDENHFSGVTLEFAEQITTLSLICLRRLQIPVDGKDSKSTSEAGRTVLAALGLCAATLAFENGMGLRSRCLLWPETAMEWELLEKPGEKETKKFDITGDEAKALLKAAIEAAKVAGLEFAASLTLKPSNDLKKLVRKSQDLAIKEVGGEGA